MKWLFFVFLILNILVFGLINLGGSTNAVDPRGRELNASQVRIVTGQLNAPKPVAPAIPASASAASQPAATRASEPVASQPAAKPQAAASPVAGKLACLRWSGFSIEQASTARNRIKALGLTASESGGAENAKAWVYIPPLTTPVEARNKAQQIAEMGVDDYFVVNDGKRWQNAISLGVYSTREAAERRLAELRAKGVRSAVIRDKDDTLKPVSFMLRNVSAENRQQLEKAGSPFRGIELRETSCR